MSMTDIQDKRVWGEVMEATFTDLWRKLQETLRATAVVEPHPPVATR